MKVKIKFAAGTGSSLGLKEKVVDASPNLVTTLALIEQQTGYPLHKKLEEGYVLLVNGKSYTHYLKGDTFLQDGDSLMILPLLGGG